MTAREELEATLADHLHPAATVEQFEAMVRATADALLDAGWAKSKPWVTVDDEGRLVRMVPDGGDHYQLYAADLANGGDS